MNKYGIRKNGEMALWTELYDEDMAEAIVMSFETREKAEAVLPLVGGEVVELEG